MILIIATHAEQKGMGMWGLISFMIITTNYTRGKFSTLGPNQEHLKWFIDVVYMCARKIAHTQNNVSIKGVKKENLLGNIQKYLCNLHK